MALLFLSSFVVGPTLLSGLNVLVLAFLGAASQQDHECLPLPAEINAVTWPEVDLVLPNADAFRLREISLLQARQCDRNFGGGRCVERVEPVRERFVTVSVNVAAELDHSPLIVTNLLPMFNGVVPCLSPATVKHCRDVLRAALNVAMTWNLVSRNAAALTKIAKPRKSRSSFYDEFQARIFLDAISKDRLGVLFWLALCNGHREAELLGLPWSNVDFEKGTIAILQSLPRIKRQGREKSHLELISTKTEESDRCGTTREWFSQRAQVPAVKVAVKKTEMKKKSAASD